MHDQFDQYEPKPNQQREPQSGVEGFQWKAELLQIGMIVLFVFGLLFLSQSGRDPFEGEWTLFEYVLAVLLLLGLVLALRSTTQFFQGLARQHRQVGRILEQSVPGFPQTAGAEIAKPHRPSRRRKFLSLVLSFSLFIAVIYLERHFWPSAPGWLLMLLVILMSWVIAPLVESLVLRLVSDRKITSPRQSVVEGIRVLPPLLRLQSLVKTLTLLAPFVLILFIGIEGIDWITGMFEERAISMLAMLAFGLLVLPMLLALLVGVFFYGPVLWAAVPLWRANYDRALRRMPVAYYLVPIKSIVLYTHGAILSFAGRHQEAEHLLRESLTGDRITESAGATLENLGCALLIQKRYDEALRSFKGVIAIAPRRAASYNYMAEIYLRQGVEAQRALELTEKALRYKRAGLLTRRFERHILGEIWANRAWAQTMLKLDSQAEQSLQHAFRETNRRFRPGLAGLHERAARIMLLRGDRAAAAQHCTQALQLDPHGHYGALAAAMLQELDAW